MKCDKSGHRLDIGDQVEIPYNQQLRRARILSIQDTDIGNLEVEVLTGPGEKYQTTIVTALDTNLVEKAVPEVRDEVIYRTLVMPDTPPEILPTAEQVQAVTDAFLPVNLVTVDETVLPSATLEELIKPHEALHDTLLTGGENDAHFVPMDELGHEDRS